MFYLSDQWKGFAAQGQRERALSCALYDQFSEGQTSVAFCFYAAGLH
jgi:hypothetical protein